MTSAQDVSEAITATVHRYLELIANGGADDIVELFADDATVEDPVGSDVYIGRPAIHGFYGTLGNLERATELLSLRVAGHEAAYVFAITFSAGDGRMRLEPINAMVFNEDGRIASMKSYWSPSDVTQC
ncbi:MAG: nuclear transport factor 2 family protein [Mycobacterium sp.]